MSKNLFQKAQDDETTLVGVLPTNDTPEPNIDDLNMRIASAIENRDTEALPWLQLELQVMTVSILTKIDWKLWETYNKFVR